MSASAAACPSLALTAVLSVVITLVIVAIILVILWCCCFNAFVKRRAARLSSASGESSQRTERPIVHAVALSARDGDAGGMWGLPAVFKDYVKDLEIPEKKIKIIPIEASDEHLGFHVCSLGGASFVSSVDGRTSLHHLPKLESGQHLIGMSVLFNNLKAETAANLIAFASKTGECNLFARGDLVYDLEENPGELCSVSNFHPTKKSAFDRPPIKIERETDMETVSIDMRASPEVRFSNNYLQQSMPPNFAGDEISINISDNDEGVTIEVSPKFFVKSQEDRNGSIDYSAETVKNVTYPNVTDKRTFTVPGSPNTSVGRSATFDDIDDVLVAKRKSDFRESPDPRPEVGESFCESEDSDVAEIDLESSRREDPVATLVVTATPVSGVTPSPPTLESLPYTDIDAVPTQHSFSHASATIPSADQEDNLSPHSGLDIDPLSVRLHFGRSVNDPADAEVNAYIHNGLPPPAYQSQSSDEAPVEELISRQTSSGVFSFASRPENGSPVACVNVAGRLELDDGLVDHPVHSGDHLVDLRGTAEAEVTNEESTAALRLFGAPTAIFEGRQVVYNHDEAVTSFSDTTGDCRDIIIEEEEEEEEEEDEEEEEEEGLQSVQYRRGHEWEVHHSERSEEEEEEKEESGRISHHHQQGVNDLANHHYDAEYSSTNFGANAGVDLLTGDMPDFEHDAVHRAVYHEGEEGDGRDEGLTAIEQVPYFAGRHEHGQEERYQYSDEEEYYDGENGEYPEEYYKDNGEGFEGDYADEYEELQEAPGPYLETVSEEEEVSGEDEVITERSYSPNGERSSDNEAHENNSFNVRGVTIDSLNVENGSALLSAKTLVDISGNSEPLCNGSPSLEQDQTFLSLKHFGEGSSDDECDA